MAQKRSAWLVDVARDRHRIAGRRSVAELADAARDRGAELAELAQDRGSEIATASRKQAKRTRKEVDRSQAARKEAQKRAG